MQLEYEHQGVHPQALARFGELPLPQGTYALPAIAPALRTRYDAEALLANIRDGARVQVITPLTSCREKLVPHLRPLLRPAGSRVTVQRPLVIADPEAEALSFNCVARHNYQKMTGASTAVKFLMMTGATTDTAKERFEVHAMWNHVVKKFGLSAVVAWQGNHLAAVGSDVFSVSTPIIRANPKTVAQALDIAKSSIPLARQNPSFAMQGVHLLLHADLFRATADARAARTALINDLNTWYQAEDETGTTLQGLVVSLKVYDPNGGIFHDPARGGIARKNLSETVSSLQHAVAAADGLLVAHNFHAWALGLLDSGADVVSARVSGPMKIDTPMTNGGKAGKRPPPNIMVSRSLVDAPWTDLKAEYEKTGAFPVPMCVPPQPYWNLKYGEQCVYANRVRMGVMLELAEEYRDAGMDDMIPLSEAVRSRVRDSGVKQDLVDLCPSLW